MPGVDTGALPAWFDRGGAVLVARVRDEGGFTVDPRTGAPPSTGFAVNTGGDAVVVPAAGFGAGTIAAFLRERPALLDAESTTLLGAWYHRGSDRVVLSTVERVADRDRAVRLGAARGQADVYDLAAAALVPTGVTRRPA